MTEPFVHPDSIEARAAAILARAHPGAPPDLATCDLGQPVEGDEWENEVVEEMTAEYWRGIRADPKNAGDLAESAQFFADGATSELATAIADECAKAALALNDPRNGPEPGADEEPPERGDLPSGDGDGDGGGEPLPKLIPMPFVKGKKPPVREWTVGLYWVPKRKVTLLQGDGGDGKSTLMQQLQSSCATDLSWLGLPVEPCDSVGFYTEDEDQDLEERQAAIDAAYGLDCRDQEFKMHLFPRVGEDNELVVFDRTGNPVLTPFYRQVREAAMDLHAGLVTLDVAVDLYGGHEIDRRQVRAFFKPLGALARVINGSVVLSSHVSQSAIRNDGGHSGSTDWSNAVRSRAYLSRPPKEKDEPDDPNARIFTRKKAQYAAVGDTIKLRWREGVFEPEAATQKAVGITAFGKIAADDLFLSLLDALDGQQRPVSATARAGNFAPRIFDQLPREQRLGYRFTDFQKAMERLFFTRAIEVVPYGRPSKGMHKIARAA